MAAQSTGIFSDKQAAKTPSSTVENSEVKVNSNSTTQDRNAVENVPVEDVDSGRAKTPVLNTGKSSGQSSVVSALPKSVEKNKTEEPKRMPWDQQTAENDNEESNQAIKEEPAQSPLPWQQQSSAKTESESSQVVGAEEDDIQEDATGKSLWAQQTSTQSGSEGSPKNTTTGRHVAGSEPTIRRVIIDPATGLYVETGINNQASENTNMNFDTRQEDLLEWPFWEMDGRIGLTVAKDSYNGSVAWEQNGAAIDFRFRGPLGFGGLRIHGDLDDKVRVKTTTGQDFTVSDFESEMQARMGWSIPINSLRFWALGIVDPEVDADVVLNEEDLLDELVQGDWKVVYEAYKEVDGVQLPRKFRITGPDTKIKMVVNDWTIPDFE